jgi:signal transduction histidine kinase
MKMPQSRTLALAEPGTLFSQSPTTPMRNVRVVARPEDAVAAITEARDCEQPFDIVIISSPKVAYPAVVQVTLIALTSFPDVTVVIHADPDGPWETLVGQLPDRDRVVVVPRTGTNFMLEQTVLSIDALMSRRPVATAPTANPDDPNARHRRHLEVVGQLAAGVAHEMNTPLQFVNDSVFFVKDGWGILTALVNRYKEALTILEAEGRHPEFVERLRAIEAEADLDYFVANVDSAFGRIDQGVGRMVEIVRALRESAPGERTGASLADVNKAVRNALTMTRGTWRYVAEVDTDLDDLPMMMCHFGELSGAIVNLLVNATHAVEDRWGDKPGGRIKVFSRFAGDAIVVGVEDNGNGIPADIADRIFDPFFSSKAVGRGTGQGLALARTAVEDRHGGELSFETTPNVGTTFFIRLPVEPDETATAGRQP